MRNKTMVQAVVWTVVIGLVLTMVAGAISFFT